MAQAAFPITAYVQLINLKSLATTAVVPARNARFVVKSCRSVTETLTGSGDPAIISIGQSASFDNIIASSAVNAAVGFQHDFFVDTATDPNTLAALSLNGNGLSVKVQDVGDYTTATAWIIVEGYFLE